MASALGWVFPAKPYYTWLNKYDLAGQNVAWLHSACRERGIKTSRKTRRELTEDLMTWKGLADGLD